MKSTIDALIRLILPLLLVTIGVIVLSTGDIIGLIDIMSGVLFYVLTRYVPKKKNSQPILNQKEEVKENEVLKTSDVKTDESRKAICPNCRSLIPIDANTCPLCGIAFQNYSSK